VIDSCDGGECETCDDGPLNGTEQSLCLPWCRDATVSLVSFSSFSIPSPASRIVFVGDAGVGPFNLGGTDVMTIPTEDAGILAIDNPTGDFPRISPLAMARRATGVTSVYRDQVDDYYRPVWVESAVPGGDAHLYLAAIGAADNSITEIPYPFAATPGGSVFWLSETGGPPTPDLVLEDRSSDPSPRLIAGRFHFGDSTWSTQDMGPAPEGVEVWATQMRNGHTLAPPTVGYSIALHFNDPPCLVIHSFQPDGSMSVVYDGEAPANVLSSEPREFPPYTDPDWFDEELIVLREDGQIEAWEIDQGRLVTIPYADAGSNARAIASVEAYFNYPDPVTGTTGFPAPVVLESTGDLAVYVNNGSNHSLMPQRFHVGSSCAACSISRGWPGPGSDRLVLATDTEMYTLGIVPPPADQ
jgi:hypothetical protein